MGLQVRLLVGTQSPPDSLEIQGLLESPCPGMPHMGHDSPTGCPRHRNHSLHLCVPPASCRFYVLHAPTLHPQGQVLGLCY